MKRWLLGLLMSATAAASLGQEIAFALDIRAPQALQDLLQRHLELQRYQSLTDLSDAELQRLLVAAREQAMDLAATLGYFSPEVRVQLEPGRAGGGKRTVTIDLEPGGQTRIGSVLVRFSGPVAEDPQALAQREAIQENWVLAVGMPFTQGQWERAKQQALQQLVAQRFPAARLAQARAEVRPEALVADLDITLESGPAYRVGPVRVRGAERYSAQRVLGLARLNTGSDYRQSDLVEAQRRLTDSGLYDSADLSLDLDSDPAQATVLAQVQEARMQKMVFGLGASTDTGARVSAEHTYNQVPGIGWKAVNKVQLDRDTRSLSSDWTSAPSESQWQWAASALFSRQSIGAFDVSGQRYRLGRLTSDTQLDQSYYLEWEGSDTHLRDTGEKTLNESVTANYAFALRNFNSMPFPTQGWAVGGDVSVGSILGSDQEPYSRVLLRWRNYQPLGNTALPLALRQRAGRLVYQAQAGAIAVGNAGKVPFSQLFLAGGDNSVRGYRHEEIGISRNGVSSAEPGRYLATAGLEWQRPLYREGVMTDWEGALFADTGAVSNDPGAFSFKTGVGAGVRWKTPIGPLQIDLAYGLATQAVRLHLNVGMVF
jgi:translocation and assembly module TamA